MATARTIKHIDRCVLDASVAVKWFSQEQATSKAEELLARSFSGTLEIYAPDSLVYEIANALFKGKHLETEKLTAALETVYNSPVQLFPPDKLLALAAAKFMAAYNITFYDAAYAALAHVLQIPLITTNSKDHKKIVEVEVVEL